MDSALAMKSIVDMLCDLHAKTTNHLGPMLKTTARTEYRRGVTDALNVIDTQMREQAEAKAQAISES